MAEDKRAEIRKDMKRLLSNLDDRWVKAASRQLCENLKQLLLSPKFSGRSNILAWTSFFPGEVDLSSLISDLVDQKTFYLPRSHPDCSMVFISIGSDWTKEVEPGLFGIPEPQQDAGARFNPEVDGSESVVLVPGVAFDTLGNRIGRGRGYYDRFLGQAGMKEAKRVGVAWDLQIVKKISSAAHDIPVDFICSEETVITAELE